MPLLLILRGSQLFRCIQVSEHFRGKSRGVQVILFDHASARCFEQGIDLVTSFPQGLFGELRKIAAIDGTERLQTVAGARNSHAAGGFPRLPEQELQQGWRDEWQVHGEHEIEIAGRRSQRRVNSA